MDVSGVVGLGWVDIESSWSWEPCGPRQTRQALWHACPCALGQTGTLRPLAGARDLSSSNRKGDFGQTARVFGPVAGFEGRGHCLDVPIAA